VRRETTLESRLRVCLDTLIDYVDVDRDGKINYKEFTRVLVAEDIMHIPPPRSGVNTSQLWGDGR